MFKKSLMFIVLSMLSLSAIAQTDQSNLASHQFEDQWGEPQYLNDQIKWVFLSKNKEGGEWIKSALEKVEITDLKQKKWLYVADISAMPSIISKLIAIPKMRDYSFSIALDKEGKTTENWPVQEEAISVYQLDRLQIQNTQFLTSEKAVLDFIKNIQ